MVKCHPGAPYSLCRGPCAPFSPAWDVFSLLLATGTERTASWLWDTSYLRYLLPHPVCLTKSQLAFTAQGKSCPWGGLLSPQTASGGPSSAALSSFSSLCPESDLDGHLFCLLNCPRHDHVSCLSAFSQALHGILAAVC